MRGSIIIAVGKTDTPTLESLINAFSNIPDRERFPGIFM